MKTFTFRILSVLLALLMVFAMVSCNEEAKPATDSDEQDEIVCSTTFIMPKGWAQDTPVWTTKDADTVTVPDIIVSGDGEHEVTNVTTELKNALAEALATEGYFKDVKNVIIIIGDGMGVSHVQASEHWSGELIMTQLPNIGISKTATREGVVTDSAAGGTAISTGYKTTSGYAAMDAEGNDLLSISELAREQGKLVGLVSNACLLDATLADFTVHNKNRSQGWNKIGEQEIVFGPDLFMGSDRNTEWKVNEFTSSFSTLSGFVKANNIKKYTSAADIISHFDDDIRMWAINHAEQDKFARYDFQNDKYPNLQQMASYALAWLDSHDKGDGFLLMIENTYTDHFGHGNSPINTQDGGDRRYGIVKEVQSTDEVVAIALKYVLEHPDTALIVTADHETGGITLRDGWEEDFDMIKATSKSHTLQDVPVFAIGKGTEDLNRLSNGVVLPEGMKWYDAAGVANETNGEYEKYRYQNALIGQVIGSLITNEPFGGEVGTDSYGKRSPRFDVKVSDAADEVTFTLDFMGVPLHDDELVQFKIKPVDEKDSVKLELKVSDTKTESLFDTKQFSKAEEGGALSPAYKQALIKSSGSADGWYQFSIKAPVSSRQIRITLTSGTGGFKADDIIGMDDLTIGYASTIGWLKFSSDNATATTEAGTPLLKYYTED